MAVVEVVSGTRACVVTVLYGKEMWRAMVARERRLFLSSIAGGGKRARRRS